MAVFHLFSQLPPELRICIWELAMATPRLVDLPAPEPPGCNTILQPHTKIGDLWYQQAPAFFFVNWESRVEALRVCNIRFTSTPSNHANGKVRHIIMASHDILKVEHTEMQTFSGDSNLVRNIMSGNRSGKYTIAAIVC
ncbi:Uu.00g066170.m01.CDS01 [Anthostomella pinea]|uniref:Uu.00g066170.m01.CDS01 n=1 Tax=Anthostomella pinea TaxID=933095 RepID=A0AAI8VTW3_9PEZI|nr:Uu.00g066170.m01.CDS01 [Anthostomella pinea]